MNKVRGYIRKSELLAGYPILFALKKDGKLRLYIDYRYLNDITVKNRYLLLLPEEIRDRLREATIFTKIDLRDGYYNIRIKKGEE